jgi:hypothetical protein
MYAFFFSTIQATYPDHSSGNTKGNFIRPISVWILSDCITNYSRANSHVMLISFPEDGERKFSEHWLQAPCSHGWLPEKAPSQTYLILLNNPLASQSHISYKDRPSF